MHKIAVYGKRIYGIGEKGGDCMQLIQQTQTGLLARFPDTLRYCSPSRGGWGVVRTGMLVPESYQLLVCPFACGRHGAIGAITRGLKHRLSYLYIDETDMVSGGYEELIGEAVEELLEQLEVRPRVLMIFVSCLDDLLGTDHEALLQVLRQGHPDMRFTICHMNPITLDSKVPPPVNIQRKIYGLLEPSDKAKLLTAAAFCGNNVSIDKNSEIYEIMAAAGYMDIHHISEFATFAEFQQLARVSLNIVPNPVGLAAANDIRQALDIDYIYVPVSYDFEEIKQNYETMLSIAGIDMDLSTYKRRALKAIFSAQATIGNLPVVIDASATIRPFTLAKMLFSFRFNVREIYAQQCLPLEEESYRWLGKHAPGIKILQPERPRSPLQRRHSRECLAIGFEGAYLTGAKYIVNLVNDETLYGYQGIEKLMHMLVSAAEAPANLFILLRQYGLVV